MTTKRRQQYMLFDKKIEESTCVLLCINAENTGFLQSNYFHKNSEDFLNLFISGT